MATYQSKRPYAYGTGRRKSSTARVHLIPNGSGSITINGRTLDEYFGLETLKLIVRQPLAATETAEKFDVEATVEGGFASDLAVVVLQQDRGGAHVNPSWPWRCRTGWAGAHCAGARL